MGIDVIPTEAISVPDGAYTGKIFDVKEETRGEGKYIYVDVYVTVNGINKADGDAVTIKDGMSKHLSKGSKLGKTCMRFGLSEQDLDKSVKEQIPIDVTYIVMNETSNDGKTYARIVDGSLKPTDQPAQQEVFAKEAVVEPPKKEEPQGSSSGGSEMIENAMEKAKKDGWDAFGAG
jgi:hypothetical protein